MSLGSPTGAIMAAPSPQHAEEAHRVSLIDFPSRTNPGINSQTHQHGECFMETLQRQREELSVVLLGGTILRWTGRAVRSKEKKKVQRQS